MTAVLHSRRAAPVIALLLFLLPNTIHAELFIESQLVFFSEYPWDLVLGDFNEDGHPDCVAVNGTSYGTVSCLLGTGNGTFKARVLYGVGWNPYSIASGDLDGDHHLDVVTTNYSSESVTILRGRGDGTFETGVDIPFGHGPGDVEITDINNDGYPDLVVTSFLTDSVSWRLNDGSGGFGERSVIADIEFANDLVVGDLNHDGVVDLVMHDEHAHGGVRVLLGNGNGTFRPGPDLPDETPRAGRPTLTDLNEDGSLDLVTTLGNLHEKLLMVQMGAGDGSFLPRSVYAGGYWPKETAAVDINGDHHTDILVGTGVGAGGILAFMGRGDGTLMDPVAWDDVENYHSGFISGFACADLDGDQRPDIVTGSFYRRAIVVWRNNAASRPSPLALTPTGSGPEALTVADLDADGFFDVAVVDRKGGTLSLLHGNGTGTFSPRLSISVGGQPAQIASGDLDGDGWPDLAFTDKAAPALRALYGVAHGIYDPGPIVAIGDDPVALATADLDGNGHPDCAVLNAGGTVSLLASLPERTLVPMATLPGSGEGTALAIGNIDGDANPDVVVARRSLNRVDLYRNRGDWQFDEPTSIATGAGPVDVAIADLNGDGAQDLVLAQSDDETAGLFLNRGDGTFGGRLDLDVGARPSRVRVGPITVYRRADIFLLSQESSGIAIFLANADGKYGERVDIAIKGSCPDFGIAPFNEDDHNDIVILQQDLETIQVLANRDNTVGLDLLGWSVERVEGDVFVRWSVDEEASRELFFIYREVPGVARFRLNESPLTDRVNYEFRDPGVVTEASYWLELQTRGGESRWYGPLNVGAAGSVDRPGIQLTPPFPNPARSGAFLNLTVGSAGRVSISVFDARGREVRRLSEETRGAGSTGIRWDGRDNGGRLVPAGVYYFRVVAGDHTASRKLVIAR